MDGERINSVTILKRETAYPVGRGRAKLRFCPVNKTLQLITTSAAKSIPCDIVTGTIADGLKTRSRVKKKRKLKVEDEAARPDFAGNDLIHYFRATARRSFSTFYSVHETALKTRAARTMDGRGFRFL